jgi:hypothetical protein
MTKQVSNGDATEAALAGATGIPIHPDYQERWEKISRPHESAEKLKKTAGLVIPLLNISGEYIRLKDDGRNGIKTDILPVNRFGVATSVGISAKHGNREMHTKRIYEPALYAEYQDTKNWSDLPVRDFTSFGEFLADTLTVDEIHKQLGVTPYYHVLMKSVKAGYYADVTYFDTDYYPTEIVKIAQPIHNRIVVTLDNCWELDYRLKNKDRAIKNGSIDASLTIIKHPYDTTRVM